MLVRLKTVQVFLDTTQFRELDQSDIAGLNDPRHLPGQDHLLHVNRKRTSRFQRGLSVFNQPVRSARNGINALVHTPSHIIGSFIYFAIILIKCIATR